MDLESELISILKEHQIEYALTLPCAKIKNLIALAATSFYHIPLSREEEGIGIATGIHLSGKRAIIMMQSGGVGNSLNALLSLAKLYSIPIPMIISWRGIYNEKIEAQKPMGEYLPKIFSAVDLPYVEIHNAEDLAKIEKAIEKSFEELIPIGILISPSFWGKSSCGDIEINYPNREGINKEIEREIIATNLQMTRFQAIQYLTPYIKDKIVISNIGMPSRELYKINDQPSNFYMLGSFGMVSAIALGVALTYNKEVLSLDGDASILTNPNILGTICQENKSAENLTIILLDNGTCGSTGNQMTTAYSRIDLETLALAYGFINTAKAYTKEQMIHFLNEKTKGPRLLHVLIKPGNDPNSKPIPLSALEIKQRFQERLKY